MKPGEVRGSLIIETHQEASDIQQALFDFSWVENTGKIFNKLSAEPPLELIPAEAVLALAALKIAQNKWVNQPDLRARAINMLNEYQAPLD